MFIHFDFLSFGGYSFELGHGLSASEVRWAIFVGILKMLVGGAGSWLQLLVCAVL